VRWLEDNCWAKEGMENRRTMNPVKRIRFIDDCVIFFNKIDKKALRPHTSGKFSR
jgi:hypothetical protein